MKYLLAVAIALLATTAQAADDVAYYSRNGESLVLFNKQCDLPGFPDGAKKAFFSAYRTMANGCYVMVDRETVLVSIQGQGQVQMTRRNFQKWEIQ